jgi:methylated-DNA-protein-cysteine methyltransferase related protein
LPPERGADSSAARVALILSRVRAIPEGFVRTYGDIDPNAPRLVGHVLASTALDVPWHRVVRADGSVAKGRPQLDLLRKEGVPLRGGRVDLRLARVPEGLNSMAHPPET